MVHEHCLYVHVCCAFRSETDVSSSWRYSVSSLVWFQLTRGCPTHHYGPQVKSKDYKIAQRLILLLWYLQGPTWSIKLSVAEWLTDNWLMTDWWRNDWLVTEWLTQTDWLSLTCNWLRLTDWVWLVTDSDWLRSTDWLLTDSDWLAKTDDWLMTEQLTQTDWRIVDLLAQMDKRTDWLTDDWLTDSLISYF